MDRARKALKIKLLEFKKRMLQLIVREQICHEAVTIMTIHRVLY